MTSMSGIQQVGIRGVNEFALSFTTRLGKTESTIFTF